MAKKPLEKLLNVTIETIMEGIEHKPWTAFINNAVAFTGVMLNNQQLIIEVREVKNNPQYLLDIETKIITKFGNKYESELVALIFKHVWGALIYNISTIVAIVEEVKEWEKHKNNEANG
jgi:hypothetical protein